MKCTAKVTSKGQITIPAGMRRELGVKAGDTLIFEKDGEGIRVARKRSGESPFAKYRGIGNPGMPSGRDAILKYMREMRGHDPDEEEWEARYEQMQAQERTKKPA